MIAQWWNRINANQKPIEPRSYIRGSEVGLPYVDRYCRMKGMQPTNDFDDRVRRIFDAGRVIEFIVMRSLVLSGLLKEKQTECRIPAAENTLEYVGHLDAIIGGFVDYDHWKDAITRHLREYGLVIDNELIEMKALDIIEGFREQFPDGKLPEMVIEVKGINSRSFWGHKNKDDDGHFRGYPHNLLQCFGYMTALKIQQGLVLYVSRDDLMMEEVPVFLSDEKMRNDFETDLVTMTKLFSSADLPQKEPIIIYNERERKVEINWMVARSNYLAYIYGYENKDILEQAYHGDILDMNRCIRHFDEANELLSLPELSDKQRKRLYGKNGDEGLKKEIEDVDKKTIEKNEILKSLNLQLIK